MNQPLQKLDTRLSTLTSSTVRNNKKSTQKSLSLQQFLWRSERFPWKILPYMTPNWSQFFSNANISQMLAYRVLSMQHQELLGTLATTSWMATCPLGIFNTNKNTWKDIVKSIQLLVSPGTKNHRQRFEIPWDLGKFVNLTEGGATLRWISGWHHESRSGDSSWTATILGLALSYLMSFEWSDVTSFTSESLRRNTAWSNTQDAQILKSLPAQKHKSLHPKIRDLRKMVHLVSFNFKFPLFFSHLPSAVPNFLGSRTDQTPIHQGNFPDKKSPAPSGEASCKP